MTPCNVSDNSAVSHYGYIVIVIGLRLDKADKLEERKKEKNPQRRRPTLIYPKQRRAALNYHYG